MEENKHPYRTVGLVIGGLIYLIVLSGVSKWLDLDPGMVTDFANAGMLMVGAGATKSAVERAAQAMGKGPEKVPPVARGVVRPGLD